MPTKVCWLILGIASTLSNDASCEDRLNSTGYEPYDVVVGGFVSQSLVKTTKGVLFTNGSDAKFGSLSRTEVGVFANYEATPYVDLRGMISSFYDSANSNGNPSINYAVVDAHSRGETFGFRLGKVSHASGFYTETMNIPAYRDMELAPMSLYREGLRNFSRSGIGAQIYFNAPSLYGWTPSFEFTSTRADLSDQPELNRLFFVLPLGTFIPGSIIVEKSVKLTNQEQGVTLRYDRNDLSMNFMATDFSGSVGAPSGRYGVTIHRLGARKYFERSDITAEYNLFHQYECGMPCMDTSPPRAYDVVYRYYLSNNLTVNLGYDAYYASYSDRHGEEQTQSWQPLGIHLPASAFYSESLSVGLNYTVGRLTYKVEAHKVRGLNATPAAENDLTRTHTSKYNVLLFNVTYSF